MKKLVIVLFLFSSQVIMGQSLLDSLSNSRFTLEDSIGNALANLAAQNLNLKVIDKQIEASKYEWQSNRAAWLNNLNATFNLNEGNIKASTDPESNIFYPRYNFSLSVPMGNFITRPKAAKKARAQYEELQVKKEVVEKDIREAVLAAYQNYKMNRYLLALQEASVQDEMIVLNQVEQKFKNNTATLEAFTLASKRLNDALAKKINLMRDVNVSKYELENLIGMRYEEALVAIRKK